MFYKNEFCNWLCHEMITKHPERNWCSVTLPLKLEDVSEEGSEMWITNSQIANAIRELLEELNKAAFNDIDMQNGKKLQCIYMKKSDICINQAYVDMFLELPGNTQEEINRFLMAVEDEARKISWFQDDPSVVYTIIHITNLDEAKQCLTALLDVHDNVDFFDFSNVDLIDSQHRVNLNFQKKMGDFNEACYLFFLQLLDAKPNKKWCSITLSLKGILDTTWEELTENDINELIRELLKGLNRDEFQMHREKLLYIPVMEFDGCEMLSYKLHLLLEVPRYYYGQPTVFENLVKSIAKKSQWFEDGQNAQHEVRFSSNTEDAKEWLRCMLENIRKNVEDVDSNYIYLRYRMFKFL